MDLIFLPDRTGRDTLTPVTGFVRLGADEGALQDLAERLTVRGNREMARADETTWRGNLALVLLADVWADADMRVSVLTADASSSSFAAWVMASQPEGTDCIRLVLLEAGGKRRLLGIADREYGLVLPATETDWTGVLPERVRWFDGAMGDPVPYLTELDRMLLQKRIRLMGLGGPRVSAFLADLENAGARERDALREGDETALAQWQTRAQAVHGLGDFASFAVREEKYAAGQGNALVRCFSDTDITDGDLALESRVYLWDGVAFAVSDSRMGLAPSWETDQTDALLQMDAEIAMMVEQSAAWARRTARSLSDWLEKRRLTLIPAVREQGDTLRARLSDLGRQVQSTVTLTWPWDASCGAVQALLREALGEGWMDAAHAPFADRLTKLTGHALGDLVLQGCCACADGVLLPPLSREMARCAALAGDGEGLAADALRFEPREDGGITASFLLRGVGEVRMQRTYTVDEMLVLAKEASPTVAVWPCVPLDGWHAYHVFARGGATVLALREGEWASCEAAESWNCLQTETYPACLCVMQGEQCLGALPNRLPDCRVTRTGEALAAIDLGTSATTAVLTLDGRNVAIREEPLTRLLSAPEDMPEDELLLSLTPRAAVPTAVVLTGEGDALFTDGHIAAAMTCGDVALRDAGTLRTALKWRADGDSVRARRILMQQVMQGLSLSAMLEGAANIRWRITIPDEMDDDGRRDMLDMMSDLAIATAKRTGLPLTAGKPGVAWAEEATALCAYLRGEGGVRGSFTALDMGSAGTKMHLWLHGQTRPTAGAVVLEGTQTLLLSALRAHPEMLAYDFADHPDEALRSAMQALEYQLGQANLSLAESDKAALMLSVLLSEYRQPITQHLYGRASVQRPTYMQSVLLENQAAMMFVAGLMLEQVGSDTLINHKLPEDMTICLTGHGAWLLDSLTPAQRNALQQIPRRVMRLDNPVRFISLKAAPQPGFATARGLADARDLEHLLDVPVIRTRASFSQLMRDMLLQFIAHYPLHAWVLHEGLFDQAGALTPEGEETIRQVAARCYGDGEDIPASVIAFVRDLRQLPVPTRAASMEVY